MTDKILKTPDNPGSGPAPEQSTLPEITKKLGLFYNKFRPPLKGEGELSKAYNQAQEEAFRKDLERCWTEPDYLRFLKDKALLLEHSGEEQKMVVLKGEVEYVLFYTENSLSIVSAVLGKPGLPPELQTRAQKLRDALSEIAKDKLTERVKAHGALPPQDEEKLKNSYAESVQLGRVLREEIEEIEESDIQKLRDENEKLQQKIVELEEKVDRLTEEVKGLGEELRKERAEHGKALATLKKIAVTVGVIGVLAGGIVGVFGSKLLKKKTSGALPKAKATTTMTKASETKKKGESAPLTEIQKEPEERVEEVFSPKKIDKEKPTKTVQQAWASTDTPTGTQEEKVPLTKAEAKQESSINGNDTLHTNSAKAILYNNEANVKNLKITDGSIYQLKEAAVDFSQLSEEEKERFNEEYKEALANEKLGNLGSIEKVAPAALEEIGRHWRNEIEGLDKKIAEWRWELKRLSEAEERTGRERSYEIDQQLLHSSYGEINKDILDLYQIHLATIKGQKEKARALLKKLGEKRAKKAAELQKLIQ